MESDERIDTQRLRQTGGFPAPDPARDERMRKAIGDALAARGAAARGGARRVWLSAAAACLLGGMLLALFSTFHGARNAPVLRSMEGDKDARINAPELARWGREGVRHDLGAERPAIPPAPAPPIATTAPPTRDPFSAIQAPSDGPLQGEALPGGRKGHGKADPGGVSAWKRSELVANTSRLMVGDKEELPLRGIQACVRVDGFRARVVLDLFFYNDRDRALEGSFQLRLPDEASPYFFAFGETSYRAEDVAPGQGGARGAFLAEVVGSPLDPGSIRALRAPTWTSPKEARMVPREKAAFAYRQEVRRSVDPAISEWAGAGVFNARVFPLAAKKLHRIVIGYDADLVRAGDDLEYRLDLPRGEIGRTADLRVGEIGVPVEVKPDAIFSKGTDPGAARSFRFDDPRDLAITLRLKGAGPILLAGEDPKTGPAFAARFRPDLPADGDAPGSPNAVFLVDVSLSSNPERFNVWRKLLKGILDENRGSLRSFAVLFFNVETFWWQERFVENTPENVAALMEFTDTLALEGASDLGAALREARGPRWQVAGVQPVVSDVFLLSDGSVTWGEGDLHALSRNIHAGYLGPLFAYATGLAGTDANALQHLARESGGAVFSVAGEAEIAKAAKAHRSRPWQIEGVRLEGASDLLLAGDPTAVYPGQELIVAGRGTPQPGVEVALALRRDGEERTVRTRFAAPVASDLAPRAYGQIATSRLEDLADAAADYARAYACHFRVTGRTCSLLMLESDAAYDRYAIKPEEDALVVKAKAASDVVAGVQKEALAALADPKARFLAWLRKMEKVPGAGFRVETALRLALEAMPAASFETAPGPLACRLHTFRGVPAALRERLAGRRLEYDALVSEASRRLAAHGAADALKALSSLVEENPGDAVLARDVAFSAMEWGLGDQALALLGRVADARPFEPQTFHAMARCLEEAGRGDLALAYYEVCMAGAWDQRFGDFRRIAGIEYLRFLKRVAAGAIQTSAPDFARARLETISREIGPGPADLLVTISWNTDGTDVDLHVTEPSGEECSYQHTETRQGGRITRDVTQGYGPEMYLLPKASAGAYRIRVHYYASDRNRASARSKVYATIVEGFGTPRERVARKVVTLAEGKDMHDIAEVVLGR